MTKTFNKSKAGKNAAGPKYRTPDHFKGSKFSDGGGSNFGSQGKVHQSNQAGFNPGQFKTQHKG